MACRELVEQDRGFETVGFAGARRWFWTRGALLLLSVEMEYSKIYVYPFFPLFLRIYLVLVVCKLSLGIRQAKTGVQNLELLPAIAKYTQ